MCWDATNAAARRRSAEPSLSRPLFGFSSARTVLADGYRPGAEPSIIWAGELDDNTAANPSCAHDSSTPRIVRRGAVWGIFPGMVPLEVIKHSPE